MDVYDQFCIFERLQHTHKQPISEWSKEDVLRFLRLHHLSFYEQAFRTLQIDGKACVETYAHMPYEKFLERITFNSLLHYQKFILLINALRKNYDSFLAYHAKFSQSQFQDTSSEDSNTLRTPQLISANSYAPSPSSIHSPSKAEVQQHALSSGKVPASSEKKFSWLTKQTQKLPAAATSTEPANTLTATTTTTTATLQQISQKQRNLILRACLSTFQQLDEASILLEKSKHTRREASSSSRNTRGTSRCIRTTARQKIKIKEIVDKLDKTTNPSIRSPPFPLLLLSWPQPMIAALLKEIRFSSLISITENWGIDGFILQILIPTYTLRQIELAFECKYEDVVMLFWLADTFTALKYTFKHALLIETPTFPSASQQSIQSNILDTSHTLNSSITLNITTGAIKKFSIDTFGSSENSNTPISQKLSDQYPVKSPASKSNQDFQKQLQQGLVQSPLVSSRTAERKESEDLNDDLFSKEALVIGTTPIQLKDQSLFSESMFLPPSLRQQPQQQNRISIAFKENKEKPNSSSSSSSSSYQFPPQKYQETEPNFADSLILNGPNSIVATDVENSEDQFMLRPNHTSRSESFTFQVAPSQSKILLGTNVAAAAAAAATYLPTIEEKDKMFESQSVSEKDGSKSIQSVSEFQESVLLSNELDKKQAESQVSLKAISDKNNLSSNSNQNLNNNDSQIGNQPLQQKKDIPQMFAESMLCEDFTPQITLNKDTSHLSMNASTKTIDMSLRQQNSQQQFFQQTRTITDIGTDAVISIRKIPIEDRPTLRKVESFNESVIFPIQPTQQQQQIPQSQKPSEEIDQFQESELMSFNPIRKEEPEQQQKQQEINESVILFDQIKQIPIPETKIQPIQQNKPKEIEQTFEESVLLDMTTPASNQKPNIPIQEFEDSVILTPMSKEQVIFQPSNPIPKLNPQPINQIPDFQESTLLLPTPTPQPQQSILTTITPKAPEPTTKTTTAFEESVLLIVPPLTPLPQPPFQPKQTPIQPEQFEESVLLAAPAPKQLATNFPPPNQFEDSVILLPTPKSQSQQLTASTLSIATKQSQIEQSFEESVLLTPTPQRSLPSSNTSKKIINNQFENTFEDSVILNQSNQYQKQYATPCFQDSVVFEPNDFSNRTRTGQMQSRQSMIQANNERHLRQSVVRDAYGEIDFNKSVIFNNQVFFNDTSSKLSEQSSKQQQLQPENKQQQPSSSSSSQLQPQSTQQQSLSSQQISQSRGNSELKFGYEDRSSLRTDTLDQQRTHSGNQGSFTSNILYAKSPEYLQLMSNLGRRTPKLCFNPFDMNPLKNTNMMKIRIQSLDGSLSVDELVSTNGASIGRKVENTINFPREQSISSFHAEIIFDQLNFYLRDRGSKLGTFIKMKEILLQKDMILQISIYIECKIISLNEQTGSIEVELKRNSRGKLYKYEMKQDQEIKIGRDKERCDIEIKDQSISGEHSRIVFSNNKFKMIDSGSLNGIWLRMSSKGEVSEPFLITPEFSFRVYLINIQVLKLETPHSKIK